MELEKLAEIQAYRASGSSQREIAVLTLISRGEVCKALREIQQIKGAEDRTRWWALVEATWDAADDIGILLEEMVKFES